MSGGDTAQWDSDSPEPAEEQALKTKQQDITQARIREESVKQELALKRKELKWKLMRASQAQNFTRLKEIRAEAEYHKQKLTKVQNLASRLREKYLKVVKTAKMVESHCKTIGAELHRQEKFVAEEKIGLTKLAFDCLNIGNQLYGPSYQLPTNSKTIPKFNTSSAQRIVENGPRQAIDTTKQRSLKVKMRQKVNSKKVTDPRPSRNLPRVSQLVKQALIECRKAAMKKKIQEAAASKQLENKEETTFEPVRIKLEKVDT